MTIRSRHCILFAAFGAALIVAAGATASGSTSIAKAPLIEPGVEVLANTSTDATRTGQEGVGVSSGCWNDLEYWMLPLTAGDAVQIKGGAVAPGSDLEVSVFPPGTTDGNIANATAVEDGFPLNGVLHFAASSTGDYPVAAGPNCYNGVDGPFDFTATVTHGAVTLTARVALPRLKRVATRGTLTATVRTPSGAPITDAAFKLGLYGTWKNSPTSKATAHLLATASPKGGTARFAYRLPATAARAPVGLQVTGSGGSYRNSSSAISTVTAG